MIFIPGHNLGQQPIFLLYHQQRFSMVRCQIEVPFFLRSLMHIFLIHRELFDQHQNSKSQFEAKEAL